MDTKIILSNRQSRNIENPKINVIVLLFLLFVFASIIKAQTDPGEAPIKVNTVLINVPVIASDKSGRNIANLKKEDFSVYQDGEKQTIEFFANSEAPMNVAIIIDTSGSITNVLSDVKKAARDFVTIFGSEDKGIILSFDHKVRVLEKLTSDQNKLRKGINYAAIDEQGETRMYDAVYQVITKEFALVKGRKAIILLTDGFEAGKISGEELLDKLIESDTLVYPIFFQTSRLFPIGIKTVTMQQLLDKPPINFLNKMALLTGGRVYAAGASNLSGAFQNIANELKTQYVVGFYPKDGETAKSNNITVKIERPDVVIRTKRTIRLKTSGSKINENKNK